MASRFRSPWAAAIVLLVMIWTIYFIGPRGYLSSGITSSIEHADIVVEDIIEPHVAPVVPISEDKGGAINPPAAPEAEAKSGPGQAGIKSIPGIDDKNPPADTPKVERTLSSAVIVPKPTPKAPLAAVDTPATADPLVVTDRPLVTYVYSQTESAEANLRFFVTHALNAAADFIFIINGEAKQALEIIPTEDNIRIVERPNDCYDLGAHAEILTAKVDKDGVKVKKGGVERWKMYKKFILLNASIRGPFMPNWANGCWMDSYLGKLNDEVKLVGMTANCWPQFHVQSMIWATDNVGISLLLYPPQPEVIPDGMPDGWKEVGINGCFHTWDEAVHAEVFSTSIIRNAGHKIAVMMSAFYSDENYIEHCDSGGNGDVLWNGRYFGTNVHPYETIFMKTNRDIDPVLIDKLTTWKNKENYTSYDKC